MKWKVIDDMVNKNTMMSKVRNTLIVKEIGMGWYGDEQTVIDGVRNRSNVI